MRKDGLKNLILTGRPEKKFSRWKLEAIWLMGLYEWMAKRGPGKMTKG